MFCKKCGEEISDESNFCPKCGENLNNEIIQNKKTRNTIANILLWCVCIFMFVEALFNTPYNIINAFTLIIGLIACPYVVKLLNIRFLKGKIKKWMQFVLIIILIVVVANISNNYYNYNNQNNNRSDFSEESDNDLTLTPVETEEEKNARFEKEKEKRKTNIEELKQKVQVYSYEQLARNPEAIKNNPVKVTGEVIQTLYDSKPDEAGRKYMSLRVNITKKTYQYIDDVSWTDTIYVMYVQEKDEDRILENDVVTIYGYTSGEYSYESVSGTKVTLPCILALSIVQGEE